MKPLLFAALLAVLSGCVQTQFHKSVTILKDADGKIISRQETEGVTQVGQTWTIQFEHLKIGPQLSAPAKSAKP
jgi:hypothetical protein